MNRNQRCLGCMELFDSQYDVCPYCGYMVGTPVAEAIHMEPGTRFHQRYIIGKVLGFGEFGVTYVAWDERLEQKVAIKEYLPSEFSTRIPGQSTVTVFSGEKNEQFRDGMVKFVDEAKRLAKFQSEPGIVRIFDSFEENGTAYIIMEYLDGMTLEDYLKENQKISEDEAVFILMPIMKSLQVVHKEGLLHRDIAPYNIFITKKGESKLIDFGASRFATTSHSRSFTVIINPAYSPEEQYRSRGDQGTYTDVYALGGTLYKMITGVTPPNAMERRAKYENLNKDILKPPHRFARISAGREIAILNALNIRIEDRTADIETFMDELNANSPAKRKYGKIKKIDLYQWPLWIKTVVASFAILILLFGLLLVTGVIHFQSNYSAKISIPKDMVEVPNVEEMEAEKAIQFLKDNQLVGVAQGNVSSEYVEAGRILLQFPANGTYLNVNGEVYLTVSSGNDETAEAENGKSIVPYVIWDTREDAQQKLSMAGLVISNITEKYDDNVEIGRVISQSIQAGTEVESGTKIELVISKGKNEEETTNMVSTENEIVETVAGMTESELNQDSDSRETTAQNLNETSRQAENVTKKQNETKNQSDTQTQTTSSDSINKTTTVVSSKRSVTVRVKKADFADVPDDRVNESVLVAIFIGNERVSSSSIGPYSELPATHETVLKFDDDEDKYPSGTLVSVQIYLGQDYLYRGTATVD